MYRCIKGFSLEKCDDNGFTIENEYEVIEEDSIWVIADGDYRLIGEEIRLEKVDDDLMVWLEFSNETLEEHFEAV